NAAANRSIMDAAIDVSIPDGSEIMLRFYDPDHTGADHGLGIDDLSVTATTAGPSVPTLTIVAQDASAAEAGSDPGTFRVTRTGATTGSLAVNYTFGGTASTADYSPGLSGTVTISDGAAFVDVLITPVNDVDPEGNETVTLTLTSSAGYTVGSPSAATVTISDDDAPAVPTVSITATDATGAEAGSDPVTFRITRTGSTTDPLSVSYTVGGTATNGTDYTPTMAGTATIAAGQPSVDITLAPTDDSEVEGNETIILTLTDGVAYDLGTASATATITDNDAAPATRIRAIQGTAHTSPLLGQTVTNVPGIVTARAPNGFYMQDPNPDADDRTSEGIFVFTGSGTAPRASIQVGDGVEVSGQVAEFGSGTNLTVTQIGSPTITELSEGQELPTAVILGNGGRAIPQSVIEDDNFTSFDPTTDGIDFYESLEGMRVQINSPVAVSPTITSGGGRGEVWVLADNGVNASGRTARGGIAVSAGDFNPERIQIDDNLLNPPTNGFVTPVVNVGALFSTITGIVNYGAGNYEVLATTLPMVTTPSPLTKETTDLTGTANQLTVGTFNVENLDPGDATFNAIAGRIVNNLRSPDILLLEEIQDNNGATNNGVVDASATFNQLISAITATNGPAYQFRQIDPLNNQDGGEPGGNIRVGFLFNPARVTFVDRPGGTATSTTTINNVNGQPQLSFSPGRVDPSNPAFDGAGANSASRKPLVGEFVFNGQTVFVIGNHFNSKGGDNPLFGNVQPPVLSSETQRNQQAAVVRDFVRGILSVNANANVIVAGDLNDFEFSNPLNTLKETPLTALIETLPPNERYTYNFEGNAQTLDHILVSNNLTGSRLDRYDVVHFNSEFADQDSDHDPSVARFNLAPSTTAAFAITDVTTVSCETVTAGERRVRFTPQYSGLSSGQPVSFSVVNELLPTTAPGPYTLRLYTDNPVITLKATQNGTAGEASFTYNWLGACTTSDGGSTPPTSDSPFSITGVTTVSCETVTAGERRVRFTPQYSGLSGQPVSFSVVNELLPTTAPGPYTLRLYTDNPVITLKATQSGTAGEASFTYNWLAACNGGSNARIGVGVSAESLVNVRIIGNPVRNGQVSVEVRGATGQLLRLNLTDMRGQMIGTHQVEQADSVEHHTFEVSRQTTGLLLLRVTTPTQSQTVKVIKVE
ncbi:MAG TPA: Calx-beta domain-containing protein, partial [Spirosoma sp.]|nr:Calx-beta domain-containing protein [Spirosoma sp.]